MRKKVIIILAMIMIIIIPVISFGQSTEITKGQFIKKVLEAAKVEVITTKSSFQPFIEAAYKEGIITEDEKLDGNEVITKEEAVVILVKAFGKRSMVNNMSQEAIDKQISFSDRYSIKSSSKPYIAYALKNSMIRSERAFYPLKSLTEEMCEAMIIDAKKARKNLFYREGLLAGEMLELAHSNLKKLKTYRTHGNFKMHTKMNVQGLPDEEKLNEQLINQDRYMDINIKAQVENPNRSYVLKVNKSDGAEIDFENEIEVFTDKYTVYQRFSLSGEKWIKRDMSSAASQLQYLESSNPQGMSMISKSQIEFFKNYAFYGEDEKIGNKEYYILHINIDKDTYKKFIREYSQNIVNKAFEKGAEMRHLNGDYDIELEEKVKQAIESMTEKMSVETKNKFYINKDNMKYEKIWMSQKLYVNMDGLIEIIEAMTEENKNLDLSSISIEAVTNMQGELNYGEYNREVNFPQIKPEDVLEIKDVIRRQN
ncbi:MAG: hypothetical protein MJA82_12085 [Clostridia bacterium]|nr:hypothetical protein [Clostridia bacterium]